MKGLSISLFILLVAFQLKAQESIILQGQTRDTTMAAISFANVMLVDTATQEMKGFAVTDVNGRFKLRLEKDVPYELQVTFVGYVPIRQVIRLSDQPDEPLLVVMKEALHALDEVTVVSEMPVIVRGDTISYKAEAFTKGHERKLEDVLAELPGFEVDENGEIEVQGQRVDKVLVDGKEFFEGDTKLATQNIPADVVDRIQVLQNFNDIAPMQGLMDDDHLALNIELKGDKKRLIFGDVEAGGGPERRYFGHANAFYYAPKTSVNFIGDANNVGQLALTLNDYFRMSGGMQALGSRNGTSIRVNAADVGIPLTDRNSARNLSNQLGALNFTTEVSPQLRVSGFLIGFDNEANLGSNALRTYPQLDDQTQEVLDTETGIDNRSGLGRFSAVYTPSYKMQVDYGYFGKRTLIDQDMQRNSQLLSGDNQLEEHNAREPMNERHQLRMFNALNERNIVSAELNYTKEVNVNDLHLQSQQALFAPFLSAATVSELNQAQDIRSERFEGVFNYYHILNSTTHLNLGVGVNLSQQHLFSQLDDEGANVNEIDQELNIFNRFVRLQYRKRWDKLTISPAFSFNTYGVDNGIESEERESYLFPQLRASYEFGSSHEIALFYEQTIEYNEVGAYAEAFRISQYNTLLFGNAGLQPARSQGAQHSLPKLQHVQLLQHLRWT